MGGRVKWQLDPRGGDGASLKPFPSSSPVPVPVPGGTWVGQKGKQSTLTACARSLGMGLLACVRVCGVCMSVAADQAPGGCILDRSHAWS